MITFKRTSFLLFTFPLIIYEITFALFVIYYIQHSFVWFRLSFFAMVFSALIAVARIITTYNKRNLSGNADRKTRGIDLLSNLGFLALYLFCLLAQADSRFGKDSPSLILICLLSIPPVCLFILFLFWEADDGKDPG